MNAKERSTAWAIDQQDSGNWLTIPDFGINPHDVAFEGFGFPIVTSRAKGRELMCIVREHVKTAREIILRENRSLSAFEDDFTEAPYLLDDLPGSEPVKISRNQAIAFFYLTIMWDAKNAVAHGNSGTTASLKLCCQAIAQCAVGIRDLVFCSMSGSNESSNAAINQAVARHLALGKQALADAGKLGAIAKHKRSSALKKWALDRAQKMRGSDVDKSRELFLNIPVHLAGASKDPQRLIYDALRAKKI